MKQFAITFILIFVTFISNAFQVNRPTYDILSHPLETIDNAQQILEDKNSTPNQRMAAIMEFSYSKVNIDRDSIYVLPKWISGYAEKENDLTMKGLMLLFKANILIQIYSNDLYRYNEIILPTSTVPNDIREWNGDLFKREIKRNIKDALHLISDKGKTSLSEFKDIIKYDDISIIFYPYLRDFAYLTAIKILNYVDENYSKELYSSFKSMLYEGTPEWVIWEAEYLSGESIKELYKKYPNGVVGAYLLLSMTENQNELGLIKEYIDTQSVNPLTKYVERLYQALIAPYVDFTYPNICYAGAPVNLYINGGNLSNLKLQILKNNDLTSIPSGDNSLNLIETISVNYNENDSVFNDTLSINLKEQGTYTIKAYVNGSDEKYGIITINATPLIPIYSQFQNSQALILADFVNGRPLKGLNASLYDPKDNNRINLGKTDKNGTIYINDLHTKLQNSQSWRLMMLINNGDNEYVYHNHLDTYNNDTQDKEAVRSRLVYSRPVYQPGESFEWSIISSHSMPNQIEPLTNTHIDVRFEDANYQPIDTLTVKIDEYGRASGSFIVPENRLTGKYRIVWEINNHFFSDFITVAEYKMPTFEIVDFKVIKLKNSQIKITGTATSFKGLPEANATVSIKIETAPWWRNHQGGMLLLTESGKTDKDGKFEIICDLKEIDDANLLNAIAHVTSISAETAVSNAIFSIGKPITLTYQQNQPINIDDKSLPISAYTGNGEFVSINVNWQLKKDNEIVLKGKSQIDTLQMPIDFENIAADEYNLLITPVDTTLCNNLETSITLYSVNNNDVPPTEPLLIINDVIETELNGDYTFLVGVPEDSYLYQIFSNDSTIQGIKCKKLSKGFTKLKGRLLSGNSSMYIKLAVVNNGNVTKRDISINRPSDSHLNVKCESWRNNLIPGNNESWTFTLTTKNDLPSQGALIASMYNQALGIISSHYPTINTHNFMYPVYNRLYLTNEMSYKKKTSWEMLYKYDILYNNFDVIPPLFMYSSYANPRGRIYRSVAVNGAPDYAAEVTNATMVMCEEDLLESAVEESDEYEKQMSDNNGPNEFEYRTGNIPQAFWMPNLSFDENGTTTISYTVPNENTGWIFNAWAWNKSFKFVNLAKTFVANKPIMVEPNLPRFLREGDDATIMATIYNNADSTQVIKTAVEIFDPTSKVIFTHYSQCDTIEKGQNAIVSANLTASIGSTSIGYRIKSTNGIFTDGEQNSIPIISSKSVVIESQNFYLTTENPQFSILLPGDTTSIRTIQYNQNPIWDVVKALSGLYTNKPIQSFDATRAIFGALVAQGLISRYPEINDVIHSWMNNPQDSSLVSELYKNEELKIALLQQTPWMRAAASQTERMLQLKITFDKNETNNILSNSIKFLEELQNADGGFSWGKWSDSSSFWITSSVLNTLGYLNDLGFLPDNKHLNNIISNAFAYLDKNVKDNEMSYTFTYSLYPERKPTTTEGESAIAKSLQQIISEWTQYGTELKARSALILNAFKYNAVANEIVNSIRQFKVNSPQVGIFFPSVDNINSYATILQAFIKISPNEDELNKMLQWLIVRTQVTDDLGSYDPTRLISVILLANPKWINIGSTLNNVKVDGIPVNINDYESITGAFTLQLEQSGDITSILFTKPENSILSYGSVTNIENKTMTEVIQQDGADISIKKQMFVNRNGEWIETTSPILGEQVKIQLSITTKRDLEYITINDERAATFEPLPSEQVSRYTQSSGIYFYKEAGNQNTRIFVSYLPKGSYTLSYNMTATLSGKFASGIATIQSQYAPEIAAHSGGCQINVTKCQ